MATRRATEDASAQPAGATAMARKPGRARSSRRKRPVASRSGRWTKRDRTAFFDRLAETCSVRLAAQAAGRTANAAYHLRRRDLGFAEQWATVLHEAYARLEATLLEHALAGCGGDEANPAGGGAASFDIALALKVLAPYHAGKAARSHGARCITVAEIEKILLRKLAAVEKRMMAAAAAAAAAATPDAAMDAPATSAAA